MTSSLLNNEMVAGIILPIKIIRSHMERLFVNIDFLIAVTGFSGYSYRRIYG